jgi:hypothetical protein
MTAYGKKSVKRYLENFAKSGILKNLRTFLSSVVQGKDLEARFHVGLLEKILRPEVFLIFSDAADLLFRLI